MTIDDDTTVFGLNYIKLEKRIPGIYPEEPIDDYVRISIVDMRNRIECPGDLTTGYGRQPILDC